jgi:DNA-binding NtrC family response regulator
MAKRRARVLVVEDERILREAIGQRLLQGAYDVQAAEDGNEGLDVIRNNPPFDLAVLDISLPGLSGTQLLRYLETESPQTEVIIITGYATDDLRARTRGAFTVLQKPFDLGQLVELVDRLLRPLRDIA